MTWYEMYQNRPNDLPFLCKRIDVGAVLDYFVVVPIDSKTFIFSYRFDNTSNWSLETAHEGLYKDEQVEVVDWIFPLEFDNEFHIIINKWLAEGIISRSEASTLFDSLIPF